MCCTGLMPDELFGNKWTVEDGRLHIAGTKRDARDRYVPLLAEPFTPTLTQNGFNSAMKRAKLGVTPYDARRSFGLWCDMAGLPGAWKSLLLRHAAKNVTELYGWRESERILEEAETKLKALLASAKVDEKVAG